MAENAKISFGRLSGQTLETRKVPQRQETDSDNDRCGEKVAVKTTCLVGNARVSAHCRPNVHASNLELNWGSLLGLVGKLAISSQVLLAALQASISISPLLRCLHHSNSVNSVGVKEEVTDRLRFEKFGTRSGHKEAAGTGWAAAYGS